MSRLLERYRRPLARLLYSGDQVECILCGFHGRQAGWVGQELALCAREPVVGAGRRRGRCMACNAWDRERLVAHYLAGPSGLLDRAADLSVLHIAPEARLSPWLMSQGFGSYRRGDRHEPGYQYPEGVEHMDITSLPFEDGSFDLLLCNHVLEHVPDDRLAMSELFRVLRPGGRAILQVPLALEREHTLEDASVDTPEGRLDQFGQADHVRLYGLDYGDRLASVGFRPERVELASALPRAGLNPREWLNVAFRD